MRIAALSDVHANLPALEAVLADIAGRDADLLLCAGDLVGYGPHPNEVVERIRIEQIAAVCGNYDEATAFDRPVCGCIFPDKAAQELGERSLSWAQAHTSEENKAFLRSLPPQLRFNFEGHNLYMTHGSPRDRDEYLFAETPVETFTEMLALAGAGILVVGHTHRPFHHSLPAGHVINCGSVGKPKHGSPAAVYALIDLKKEPAVSFIEVPYDADRTGQDIIRAGLPAEFAEALRTGR
ncbi:MAG: metallophosphoesterase family protein [Bacillota bacterium]